jgi:hypothetical protein
MQVSKRTGLKDETRKISDSHYGWWTQLLDVIEEEEDECFGFEVNVFFPRFPDGFLPAFSVQLWSYRLQFGWFY